METASKEAAMSRTFTAYVEYDPDTSLYVGTVPGLQGGHTQAASLDELHRNLQEVIELILDEDLLQQI